MKNAEMLDAAVTSRAPMSLLQKTPFLTSKNRRIPADDYCIKLRKPTAICHETKELLN